jgi:anti-sigma factor RsiW
MWTPNSWACRRTGRSLGEYLDGTLPLARRRKVEAHMRGCAGCRYEMKSLRRTVGLLAELPKRELSADFEANLQARLAGARPGRRAVAGTGFFSMPPAHRLLRLAPLGAMAAAVMAVSVWRLDAPQPKPKSAPAYVAAVVQEHQGLGMAPDLNATVVSHNLSSDLLGDGEDE